MSGMSNFAFVVPASLVGDVPAFLTGVPSDVMKKYIILGHAQDPYTAIS